MKTHSIFVVASIVTSVAACGPSSNAPSSTTTKPEVIVTIDGEHHVCLVSKSNEPIGNTLGCADVLPFVRDELRIAAGKAYDVHTTAPVDAAEVTKVKDALNGAGYRFVGN